MKAPGFNRQLAERLPVVDLIEKTMMRRPPHAQMQLSMQLPSWMIQRLDEEACRLNTTRQAVVKDWLVEKLEVVDEIQLPNARFSDTKPPNT
jgi:hypothetical protein